MSRSVPRRSNRFENERALLLLKGPRFETLKVAETSFPRLWLRKMTDAMARLAGSTKKRHGGKRQYGLYDMAQTRG